MILDTDPYTGVSITIDNIDGALDSLHEIVKFEVKPPDMYSNLNFFYDAQCYVWRYILCANGGEKLCTGTFNSEEIEQAYELAILYSDLTSKTERELGEVVNALTDLLQEDFTMTEKANDVIECLVQKKQICSSTGDSIRGMLNSRNEC